MRIIISIFFLFFSKSIFSDEITDFEINGFSVGISLLEFLTEKEIINKTYYEIEQGNNKEMGFVNFTDKEINLNNFFLVKAWYKKNDPKFTIYSLSAFVDINDNIDICVDKKNEIVKDIKSVFTNIDPIEEGWVKHDFDHKSKTNTTFFFFTYSDKTTSFIRVACYDWSQSSGYDDQLRIEIVTEEYYSWLLNVHSELN
tara:strand:+ start:213 stop:809 length:597 start_codon:yes stop_codon:yes gene_type:complete